MKRDLSQPIDRFAFRIEEHEIGLRLDHVLQGRIHWRSRTDLQDRIKAGKVLVNDRSARPSQRLIAGDAVAVVVTPADLPDQDPASVALSILHEDDRLVVLDKQPGQIVHPTGRHVYDTIMNALFLRYRRLGEDRFGVRPEVVHRLDRETSGVLVVAKNLEAKRFLQEEFESRRVIKHYVALVEGHPSQASGIIDAPLARDEGGAIRLRMKVDANGLPSRTDWELVETFADAALVRFRLHTGRQHQIRVHAASIGHALLADPLYGDPRDIGFEGTDAVVLGRQALHAESLELRHPDGSLRRFTAPPATDIARVIEGLRRGRRLVRRDDNQSQRWLIR